MNDPYEHGKMIDETKVARARHLYDVLTRTIAVMEETKTDNGNETVADAHTDLYVELAELALFVDMARFSSGTVTFHKD